MKYKYLRLAGLSGQALFCLGIFAKGLVTHVPFFYTFLGPAVLLVFIALHPNYYYDIIAITAIILLVILSLIFSAAVAIFNQSYLVALVASGIPISCLASVLYSMEKLKNTDPSYS